MLQSFPLLAFSLVLYAGLSLLDSATETPWYHAEAMTIHLMSGDIWHVATGDMFLIVSMILLFIEILRATNSDGQSIINHAFSFVVFVVAGTLFLTSPGFGNSVFVIFMLMTLLDFLAGFIITTVTSRRDISFNRETN
jgi:hypothetical protein